MESRALIAYLLILLMASNAGGILPGDVATLPPTATATPVPTASPVPTATPTPDPNQLAPGIRRTLWRGMSGSDVRVLQLRLIELGYLSGAVDGSFGNRTETAVKRFQYYHSLLEDGIAGPTTLFWMFSSDAMPAPPDINATPPPLPTLQPTLPPPPPTLPPVTAPPITAPPTAPPVVTTASPAPTVTPTATPVVTPTPPPSAVLPSESPAVPPALPFPTYPPTDPPVEPTPTHTPEPTPVSIVQRGDYQVRIDGVFSGVIPAQAQIGDQQIWMFPLLSLVEAMGLTADSSQENQISVSRYTEEKEEVIVVLSYSLDSNGAFTDIFLMKGDDDKVAFAVPGLTLIQHEDVLYASVEFVQYGLGYAVAEHEPAVIDLMDGWVKS